MSIEVITPGLLSTVQDAGRTGWRRFGVGQAGAADGLSLRIGNLLVGNFESESPEQAAALEITLEGPTLRFAQPAEIALTGAEIDADCDGQAIPGWRRLGLPAGATLRLGRCRRGARAYLAVRGGLAIAPVLGSRSTDLRGGFGGLQGRALRRGDRLPLAIVLPPIEGLQVQRSWANPAADLDFMRPAPLRVLLGDSDCETGAAWLDADWRVSAQSDRQGLRLLGPPLPPPTQTPRISSPLLPGGIQLPANGQPILLGVDAQTVGGYPLLGHVIQADLCRVGQLRPGDTLRFEPIDSHGAAVALRQQAQRLYRMRLALEAAVCA